MAFRPPSTNLPPWEDARDEIFVSHQPTAGEFRFDEQVARVFPDMLRRSIPGYGALLELIGVLASCVVTHESRVYDLGCSLGAVSLSIRHALGSRCATILAVDNSEAMVRRCREFVEADSATVPVEVHCNDVTTFPLEEASLIVSNFTLQFVPPDQRLRLLERARNALGSGGVFVLSEKVRASEGATPSLHPALHDAFRQANGYTQLELSRKRQALEHVLIADSEAEHEARLRQAGFEPEVWFRALDFVSWTARVR